MSGNLLNPTRVERFGQIRCEMHSTQIMLKSSLPLDRTFTLFTLYLAHPMP
ncbi:hypothetical protein V3C99_003201 [Haemonchus contortus]|uniref:Uncharacterized protein n=1 Tax=Haemonchus contortus TaxID=6289 RepID=A0A7I4XZ03_HAECO